MSESSEPILLDYTTLQATEVVYTAGRRVPGETSETGAARRTAETAYEIRREIARGGMGVVYEAKDRDLGRIVALKIMRGAAFADAGEIGRFRAETEAAARLDHPHIVPVYEVGEMQGQPFFTMKLIEGGNLVDELRKGPIPPRKAAGFLVKIARAVHHAHERGVLHRDIKPANVLLDSQGEPYLTDFGVAKLAGRDSGFTLPGDIIGTTEYMAPEQTRGDQNALTTACDVWALGVLLYQMLSGRLPFTGENQVQIIRSIVQDEPQTLGRTGRATAGTKATTDSANPAGIKVSSSSGRSPVDRDLATIVSRCLEKDVARRMPGADFLAEELERWLAGVPIESRRVTPAERMWKWVRRYPLQVATVLTILISVLAGSIVSFVLWQKAQSANISLNSANASLSHSNEELAQSLRLSKATHLASESREQSHEDGTLGALLAVESAETTRRVDGTVLPESVSALLNAVQQLGGVDATPGRGLLESDLDYRTSAREKTFLRPSPDGRWQVMIDFTKKGIIATLYNTRLPLAEEPVRRWFIGAAERPERSPFEAAWTADSKKLLTLDFRHELLEWDLVAGIDERSGASVLGAPPVRSLGSVAKQGAHLPDARFLRNSQGDPSALLYVDKISETESVVRWRTLDLAASQPLGESQLLSMEGVSKAVRHRLVPSPDGKWGVWYDIYLNGKPVLIPMEGNVPGNPVSFPKRPSRLESVAFSKDSKRMALGWMDGAIAIYDITKTTSAEVLDSVVPVFERGNACMSLAFSPDGESLAATGQDSLVQVIPLRKGSAARTIQLRVSGKSGLAVAFSADGEWLAMCASDRVVNVWPVGSLHQSPSAIEYRGMASVGRHVEFSPDGRILTALGGGGECRRWAFSGQNPGAMPICSAPDRDPVKGMAVSPDGRWLAVAPQPVNLHGGQTAIRLLDVANGLTGYALPGHVAPSGVAFSRDGRWLASTGQDARVQVWDVAALATQVAGGSPVKPLHEFRVEKTRETYDRKVTFHPQGRLYCTTGDGLLFEWNLNAADPAASVKRHRLHSILYLLPDVAVSPDGKWLAVSRHGHDSKPREGWTQTGNMVLLFDVSDPDTMVPKWELPAHFREIGALAFSPDSRWLGAGAQDGCADIWDLTSADVLESGLSAPVSLITAGAVAFSPQQEGCRDRPWLALGSSDGKLQFWDWSGGPGALRRLETKDPIHAVVALPDGRIATGGRDSRIRIWDTDPARLIEIARRTAGRVLTPAERERFGAAGEVPKLAH